MVDGKVESGRWTVTEREEEPVGELVRRTIRTFIINLHISIWLSGLGDEYACRQSSAAGNGPDTGNHSYPLTQHLKA
jgi:hypothetical protein